MGDKSGVLKMRVDGNTVTGSLSDADHHVDISDGKLEGNRVSWHAGSSKPMRLSFKFTAVVEENRIVGDARHVLGSAPFTGTRL